MEGALGVIPVGALGIIFGVAFFAREEDLNQHQRKYEYIPGWSNPGWSNPTHTTSPEWKPKKKTKKERKKRNRKRVWRRM